MKEYLGSNIKDIIEQFPAVGEILEEYKIACVTCGVGTCQLKEIIEIHNLPEHEERQVMTRIAGILYPGQEVEIPRIERKRNSSGLKYSPPIKMLVDEHTLIKRLLACIPRLMEELTDNPQRTYQSIEGAIEFIRSYADRFHHAKEEDVLFDYCDENAEILHVMHQDHENARRHVGAMKDALERRDPDVIEEHLADYRDLLSEHIKKEDEVLYPWIDRNLSLSQVGEIFTKFNTIGQEFGDIPRFQEDFIKELEDKLMQ